MARARVPLLLLVLAACRPPQHEPAPVPARPASPTITHETHDAPSTVKVAVFDPTGTGNWSTALDLSPAPASLVAPCLPRGATGWVSVNVDTHGSAASTTSIVEAASDTTAETQECIAKALTGVHTKLDAMRVLVYVTFSAP